METTEFQSRRRSGRAAIGDGWKARGAAEAVGVGMMLPPNLVFLEQRSEALRACLRDEGLEDYSIFQGHYDDLRDLDAHLTRLDPSARWAPQAILTGSSPAPAMLARRGGSKLVPSGFLVLVAYRLVIARHFWVDDDGDWQTAFLCAAERVEEYDRFKQDLRARRHEHGGAVWQVVSGDAYLDGERIPRTQDRDEQPLLPVTVLRRIDSDVIRFFSPEVAALYQSMGVPYRRGVLLHGPPGNGKTSTIRYAGAMLPNVPGFVLRPKASFDGDDFETVINRWRRQAPAILVIEDLNWLLKSVNLSSFLNLLDGIDSPACGGLLLLATTNHPEQLDPAVNSRPGRFDVVIEIPSPDASLRREYLGGRLGEIDGAQLDALTDASRGMSFAHLQEVLRLAGLLAIQAGRLARGRGDLDEAMQAVRRGIDDADRGFARELEVPFGLAPRRTVGQ